MGGKSMFELKEALAGWRNFLRGKSTLLDTDIQELESHLLEELELLKDKGLSEEEAFLVASRRLGRSNELSDEFSKINGNAIWGYRLIWMALGLLSYLLMKHLIQLVNGIYVSIAVICGISGYQLGVVSVVSSAVLLGTALFGCYAIVSKYGSSLRERFLKSTGTSRRRLFFLAGFVVSIVLLILSEVAVHLIAPRYASVASIGKYHAVTAIASLVWSVILPALLIIFVSRIRRRLENQ
jgi:hypothetical protein